MLTRVYGTAYTKKADLDAYLEHLEDIKNATTINWDVSWNCLPPLM